MQPRHRRGEAQAEPGARLRTALFEADEALDHTRAVGFRNARSAVGDGEQDAVALVERAHHDFRRRAVGDQVARLGIFDGIVDQIGERLADQLAVAFDLGRRIGLNLERDALLLGQRLVQLADVVGDLGGVELAHVVARLAGFGARDHQQRVEGADQPLGVLDCSFQRGAVFACALGGAQRLLAAIAQARERRLEIVRDIVGDLLQAVHQRLDALQHDVEVLGQPIELVAGAGDELDRLAENLNVMLERIEALMHGLKEVSDNIAHDLKTPLTRLRNRCEEALRTAKSAGEYRAALEGTIEDSEGLIRTFNALLRIARAESGQARDDMSEFDAAEIAHDIGELYEPLAEQKGIALQVEADAPAKVKGNRELVSQALANLVDNAIKYAEPRDLATNGVTPEIVVRAFNEGDRILLTVADSGPGIPEADRARVVERFVRLEQSRSQPGSGLGLSLASAVARLHGGDLTLEDNHPGLISVIALPRGGPVQSAG